ncbi:AEC family transporter [Bifidobacterium vansinderenii]|uniref:Transporter auxin efflux carrier (AEC) family protein n=1 Tax=Bifidobacterium vansinderenii TaxID=1984871 RepID=A0A229VXJ6_9BIFI|nr:AEC family transporter [Bifidobacterium vansinderenii]OXN00358.1 transporter auxin efflux carrier (AEC) family protein [Bifidobacterium vansinderenii]
MVDLTGAITQMVVLVAITIVGFAATKLGYLDDHVKAKLTLLLLNVTLPCMILGSAGDVDVSSAGRQVVWSLGLGVAQFFLLLVTGALCNLILRTPFEQRPIYLFMSVCTNTGFIGIPVAAAIYGNASVLLSSMFITAISLFFYSIGIALISPKGTRQGLLAPFKAAVNPSSIAAVLALVLLFSGVHLPNVVEETLTTLGGITGPIAMLLVGVVVAGLPLREVVSEWRIYPFTIIRQLLVPAALFVALRPIVPDPTVLGVFTVMFAMPTGSMASMFAAQYGRDPKLPAKGTILTTVASFAIIPALILFMTLV